MIQLQFVMIVLVIIPVVQIQLLVIMIQHCSPNVGSWDIPNGCGDPLYIEYSSLVTCSDTNACNILIVNGCTDSLAINYIKCKFR